MLSSTLADAFMELVNRNTEMEISMEDAYRAEPVSITNSENGDALTIISLQKDSHTILGWLFFNKLRGNIGFREVRIIDWKK